MHRAKKLALLTFMFIVTVSSCALGQCPDFLEYFKSRLSEDPVVRERAIAQQRGIVCFHEVASKDREYLDQEILPIVSRALASPQDKIRATAASVLMGVLAFRNDSAIAFESFVPALLERFDDPRWEVRSNAVRAIAGMKPGPPASAVEALVGALGDRMTSGGAFTGLARVSPMTDRIAEAMLKLLDRLPDAAKVNLVRTLSQTRDMHPRIASALREALHSQDKFLQETAGDVLRELERPSKMADAELPKIAPLPRMGEQSVVGLRQCPDFLQHIKDGLSEDPAVRESANTRHRECDCLYKIVWKDREYLDREILPIVRRALASRQDEVRMSGVGIPALLSMSRIDSAAALESFVPALLDRFDDPHRDVRSNAVLAIGSMKPGPPASAADALLFALGDDRNSRYAFAGLARVSPMTDKIADAMLEFVDGVTAEAQGNLLRAWGQSRDLHPRVFSKLLEALHSRDRHLQETVLGIFIELGPVAKAAAPALRRLAQDPQVDDLLAHQAARAADRVEK